MDVTIAELIAMRKAGFTIQEVADKAGCSATTIHRFCHQWGVYPQISVFHSRRRKRKLDGREEEIRSLYWDQGLSTREIAEQLGVSKMAVLDFMKVHGIPQRDRLEAMRLRLTGPTAPPRRRTAGTWTREQAIAAREKYHRERRQARAA